MKYSLIISEYVKIFLERGWEVKVGTFNRFQVNLRIYDYVRANKPAKYSITSNYTRHNTKACLLNKKRQLKFENMLCS